MSEDLRNQELINHIRRRPAMYFGSVGVLGVEQLAYELVSNVLDLYLTNQATFVDVELNGVAFTVADDGPGLPFDQPSDREGMSLATKFLTYVHTTRSQDEHVPHVHMNQLGIGLAPLNAASTQLTVQSWRSGNLWQQYFVQGVAQDPAIVVEQGNGRGTRIHVVPNAEIFGQAEPRAGVIRSALFEAAHLFSGLRINFHGERFQVTNGLQTLGFMLLSPLSLSVGSKPLPFHVTLRTENTLIEVAVFGERRSHPQIFSWVNGSRTPEHGSHVEGLLEVLKEVGWKPALSLIHVVMFDPAFAGPAKTKLDAPHIREAIPNILREPLIRYRNP
ncbi:hypothetical protein [Pantanalinema sp. GBBB05]|uniref:hypothetical protein n=1 Tax=Pantanalinema sp. GBBB05 TaxID=2604139 RepID=UPI001D694876|nr:hypothetical protein [Pantanalinema sp. GBBB05]